MDIREMSRKYGVTMDKLRYYEKMGLLEEPKREHNKRIYTDKQCKELEYVMIAREGELPIELIRKYMVANRDENVDIPEKKELLLEEIQAIQEHIDRLNNVIKKINVYVAKYSKIIDARIAKAESEQERERIRQDKKEKLRQEKEERIRSGQEIAK